jgi:hypothetical protein
MGWGGGGGGKAVWASFNGEYSKVPPLSDSSGMNLFTSLYNFERCKVFFILNFVNLKNSIFYNISKSVYKINHIIH